MGTRRLGSSFLEDLETPRTQRRRRRRSALASRQYVDAAIAVNKAYVDTAVANLGSGSYVSKNGDAMSGPLSLPSDAAAANGINIARDQQSIADIKELIVAIEAYAKSAGLTKPRRRSKSLSGAQQKGQRKH